MKEKIKRSQVIKKRIVKSILWAILTPFLLLGLIIGLIHLPPIQNYLIDELTTYFTEGTGYETSIDYVNIKWFNAITLEGIKIEDHNQVTMIGIDEAVVSFSLTDFIGKRDISTKEAWVKGANVNLRDEQSGGLNIDDWALRIAELNAPETPDPDFVPAAFMIDQISLRDSRFSLSDGRRDSLDSGFDYNHFQLLDVNADLLNLKAVADTFQIDIEYLTTIDSASGFKIDKLETFFRNSWKGMAFYDLDLQTGNTRLTNEVVFNHDRPRQMGYFVDSIYIETNFEGSYIDTETLSYFAPELSGYNEIIGIDGFFEGYVHDFFSDNFKIDFGDKTSLKGAIEIEGLPFISETLFDVSLENSTVDAPDFRPYLDSSSFNILNKLGLIRFGGQFDGLVNDFVAEGDFETVLGSFSSNTQITTTANALPSYNGYLNTNTFDLGEFTGLDVFQKIDLNGSINGSGFTLEEAEFDLVASIERLGFNEYDYKQIETDGSFAESFFSGQVRVDDPNFRLFALGSIDLRDNINLFNLSGSIDTARLDQINITQQDVKLATDFTIDVTGLQLDSIVGDAFLTNTYFNYKGNELVIDSLNFNSKRNTEKRNVSVKSNLFKAQLDGDFEFSTLVDEVVSLNEQYRLIFSSQQSKVEQFLAESPPTNSQFNIRYSLEMPNINPIIQLFDSSLFVSRGSLLQGRFSNAQQEDFNLNFRSDTVRIANIWFHENELDINANSLRKANDLLTLGYLYSARQQYANTTETENLTLEAVWDGQHIDIRQNIGQESSGNYAEIGANIDFFPDRTELRFSDSNILAIGENWSIAEDNVVIFGEKRIDIENLNIYNQDQSIGFQGQVAVLKDSSRTLRIEFNEVEVANINPLTNKEYTGKLSGSLSAQNLYYNPILFGDINLQDFRINTFTVGDIAGSLNWNDLARKFDLRFRVNRDGRQIVALDGDFFPSKREANQLDLNLRFNNANLSIVEPYIEDYFTNIGGFINGQYTIRGSLSNPVMLGNGNLSEGQMKINYLNTDYLFDGEINLSENLIKLESMNLADLENHNASLEGVISHNYFKDFKLDLNGNLNGLKVLNTNPDISDLYYGEAYATGTLDLIGEASNLTIGADVRTDPNTRLYIPISEGTDDTTNPDYINFIDRTDSTAVEENITESLVDKIEIEGLKLDLDIEATPDAYVEIIIDAKSGDIIRGRSEGQLRLLIDTNGDFDMTGELSIVDGGYNFSLYNIITKEFDVEQPSTITWYGDPYEGVMNIRASYSQNTSLQPILEESGFGSIEESGNSALSRRYPTKVLLNLNGPLLSPEIGFDIDFSEIQGQENQVALNAFKNRVANDEQELNRQVLSLIVLNRFSNQGSLNIGGRTASQNVSQLLSNQLSQLIAQLDENLEIDFDLADLDENAFNTFQLRLSYTFLDGRLRVTREGGLTNLVDVNSIAGDWTAEYLLTNDGRYKVKVYSRNNFNLANLASNQNATTNTTGASLTQTTSFNTFGEFFSGVNRKRKKRKEKKQEN